MVLRVACLTLWSLLVLLHPAWGAEFTLVPLQGRAIPVALSPEGALVGFQTVFVDNDHFAFYPWVRLPDGSEEVLEIRGPNGSDRTTFADRTGPFVVGTAAESACAPCVETAFRWSKEGGFIVLPTPTPGQRASARAVNAHGTVVGIIAGQAALWLADQPLILAPLPSVALAINSAGVAVGQSQGHATRWTAEGMMILETTYAGSRAVALNDHGTMTGSVEQPEGHQQAFVWTADGGFSLLPPRPGAADSEGRSVTADGTVYGNSGPGAAQSRMEGPVRWRASDDAVMVEDLQPLIDAPGWTLLRLLRASPAGLLLAFAQGPSGRQYVLLVPQAPAGAGR